MASSSGSVKVGKYEIEKFNEKMIFFLLVDGDEKSAYFTKVEQGISAKRK